MQTLAQMQRRVSPHIPKRNTGLAQVSLNALYIINSSTGLLLLPLPYSKTEFTYLHLSLPDEILPVRCVGRISRLWLHLLDPLMGRQSIMG